MLGLALPPPLRAGGCAGLRATARLRLRRPEDTLAERGCVQGVCGVGGSGGVYGSVAIPAQAETGSAGDGVTGPPGNGVAGSC